MVNFYKGHLTSLHHILRKMSHEESVEEALAYYDKHNLKVSIGSRDLVKIKRNLRRMLGLERIIKTAIRNILRTPFKVAGFKKRDAIER